MTINDNCTATEAAKRMASRRVDALLVTSEETGLLVGILTDKDLTYRVVARSVSWSNLTGVST